MITVKAALFNLTHFCIIKLTLGVLFSSNYTETNIFYLEIGIFLENKMFVTFKSKSEVILSTSYNFAHVSSYFQLDKSSYVNDVTLHL